MAGIYETGIDRLNRGIACIFVIFIIKNLREYGIMKAMGGTTREISLLIVLKVGLMNAVACGIGVLAGALAVWAVAGAGGVDISAFTSHNPKILLADEPPAHLDTATGRNVVDLMREMGRASGCTVIMATHDTGIMWAADTILYLKDGQVLRREDP